MKSDQMGTRTAHPSPQELLLSNWTRFRSWSLGVPLPRCLTSLPFINLAPGGRGAMAHACLPPRPSFRGCGARARMTVGEGSYSGGSAYGLEGSARIWLSVKAEATLPAWLLAQPPPGFPNAPRLRQA